MSVETATYISDLNTSYPASGDPKSEGDNHLRLIKQTVKTTFPNVAGAVTPTHTELNFVDGVTSAIQTQLDGKATTSQGAKADTAVQSVNGVSGTAVVLVKGDIGLGNVDNTSDANKPVSTATQTALDLKAPTASPAFTGTPTVPTASPGTNTTQAASTAFVMAAAFSSSLPSQTGNAGKFVTTDGTNASWGTAGDVLIGTAQTLTAPKRGTVTTDNDLSFDLNVTNNFACTTAGSGTLTFTNITAGQSGFILLTNASNHTISAAATTKVSSTFLTRISASGTYLLSYFSDGTNVYVVASEAFA